MNIYETVEYKNFTIKIIQDEDPEDPRSWSNLGTMTFFHKRYNLGDKHFYSPEEFKEFIKRDCTINLPVYMMDHSGVSIRTNSFNDLWDSGCIGYIWMTKERAVKEFGRKIFTKKVRECAIKCMESEVEVYNKYLSGGFVGFVVENKEGEHLDSCWGFDEIEYCRKCARKSIDSIIKRVKGQIC